MTRSLSSFYAHDRAAQAAWATDFEAHLRPGVFLCAHNWVTEAVRRDPNLDNNMVQAEGMAACIAAQLAALEAKEKAES
jgi:hypothetical protein